MPWDKISHLKCIIICDMHDTKKIFPIIFIFYDSHLAGLPVNLMYECKLIHKFECKYRLSFVNSIHVKGFTSLA